MHGCPRVYVPHLTIITFVMYRIYLCYRYLDRTTALVTAKHVIVCLSESQECPSCTTTEPPSYLVTSGYLATSATLVCPPCHTSSVACTASPTIVYSFHVNPLQSCGPTAVLDVNDISLRVGEVYWSTRVIKPGIIYGMLYAAVNLLTSDCASVTPVNPVYM